MAEFSASGNRSVQLFLKITLDNYPKYEDVKAALPGINFTLVSPKIVFRSDANGQSRSFDSTKDDPLSIVGSNLLYGLSAEDYRVNVGVGLCNITGVTDNAIACLAPSVRPHNGNDTPVYCEKFPDHLAVMVTAALKYNYFAYCIRYSDTAEAVESSVFLIVGLCVGVGGSVLLLVAIALAVAVRRKQTKKKKKKKIQRQRQSPTNSTDQDSNSRREPYTRSIELNSYDDRLDQNAIGDLNDGPYYGRRLYNGDDDDHLGSRPGFQGSRQSHETTTDVSRNAQRNPDGKPLSLAFHGDGSKRFSWTRGARHGDYDVQIAENAKSNYATSFPKVPRPARPSKGGESNNYHKNLHDYSRNIPMQREFKSIDEDYAS